jgi:hypothetical protein
MGKFKRQKPKVYVLEALPIVVRIDGKDTIFATQRQGQARFELVDHLKEHFGAGNVRMMTQLEKNRAASGNHGWGRPK